MQPFRTCLWFDSNAQEAVGFYLSVFKNAKITASATYPDVGQEIHHRTAGSLMAIAFELNGQNFLALNGGPLFKFTEAVSIMVPCDTQEEIDYYWEKLSKGGDKKAQQCGWLKDKFGLSWQICPTVMERLMVYQDKAKGKRVMEAMMKMKKLNIAELQAAYDRD